MARFGTLVKTSLVLLVVAFLFPTPVHANTRVPMIFLTWPAMLVGLVPIIVIIMDGITPGRGSQKRLMVKSREEPLEQGTRLLTGGGDG